MVFPFTTGLFLVHAAVAQEPGETAAPAAPATEPCLSADLGSLLAECSAPSTVGPERANLLFGCASAHAAAGRDAAADALFARIAEESSASSDPAERRVAVLSVIRRFDALVRLSRAGVTSCTTDLIDAANAIVDGGFPSAGDAGILATDDERAELTRFLATVPVVHCQQLLLEVVHTVEDLRWEEGAAMLLRIHDELPVRYPGYRCLDARRHDMMDGVLYKAANYLENAGRLLEATAVRERLPLEHPESPFVPDAEYEVGQAYVQMALFERAAEAFEASARDYVGGPLADLRAPEALLYAIDIRIGLGQDTRATADADFLDQNLGSSRKYQRLAAVAYFKVGDLYTNARDWDEVIRHYEEYLDKYGRKGGKEFEIRATMLAAEAHWNLVDCTWDEDERRSRQTRCRTHEDAAFHLAARAIRLVHLPEYSADLAEGETDDLSPPEILALRRERTWNELLAQFDIEVEGPTAQFERVIRVTKVAEALGQARFYLGEQAYDQFLDLSLREFRPGDYEPDDAAIDACRSAMDATVPTSRAACQTLEAYKVWTEQEFVPWTQAKYDAIDDARAIYQSIAYLDVPAWEIAAAQRVGDMYARFRLDLQDAPVPWSRQQDDFAVARARYAHQRDVESELLKQKAVEAYGYCDATARREQWYSEHSEACRSALEKLAPDDYPPLLEARPQPGLSRIHYAVPDIDLDSITEFDEYGAPVLPVDPVPGHCAIDDLGRYRFLLAPPPAPEHSQPGW
ncbi:MAG: hypothetical protein HY905_21280 [Deltaproteobacteria bacterium]|nr:hypothetical protein [Deltaproteobacteria bacterium]